MSSTEERSLSAAAPLEPTLGGPPAIVGIEIVGAASRSLLDECGFQESISTYCGLSDYWWFALQVGTFLGRVIPAIPPDGNAKQSVEPRIRSKTNLLKDVWTGHRNPVVTKQVCGAQRAGSARLLRARTRIRKKRNEVDGRFSNQQRTIQTPDDLLSTKCNSATCLGSGGYI